MSPRFRLMLVTLLAITLGIVYLGLRDLPGSLLYRRQECPVANCPLTIPQPAAQQASHLSGALVTAAQHIQTVNVSPIKKTVGFVMGDKVSDRVYSLVYQGTDQGDGEFQCKSPAVKVSSGTAAVSIPVCVFTMAEDKWVSGALHQGHLWEQDVVISLMKKLLAIEGAGFIDIGANIGVYALTAAVLGRPVVAVEPMIRCIQRMYHATTIAKTTDQVTFVHGAVSNVTGQLYMAVDQQNKGGSFVTDAAGCNKTSGITACDFSKPINTILMDDLAPVIKFKVAGMKVDAETHEPEVFAHADKLFETIDVQFVQMEWAMPPRYYKAKNAEGLRRSRTMIEFFTRHKYTAYKPKGGEPLDINSWHEWPIDVLWKK